MLDIPELVEGYRTFFNGRYQEQAALYNSLATRGQAPKTMIVACCDSRVDPATVFSAGPGQLFVVRNVANLVPPFEPDGEYHGTSAALEFAVTGLEVENVVVMGHARCGGVRAFLDGHYGSPTAGSFIGKWMSILRPAGDEVLAEMGGAPIERQQEALEHASIRHSLGNLETFPFVRERLEQNRLRLRGAYFGIASGVLQALDPESGAFMPVPL